jgi:pyridoxamine 5'-phosphate oxidase
MKDFLQERHDFMSSTLSKKDVDENPVLQFEKWYNEAVTAKVGEANAMSLSTVDKDNKPHSRVVLLRDVNENGFVFFTNYNSAKGHELMHNPSAALLFFWPELERQVRIEGIVKKTDDKLSDNYFNSRPKESRIGAWASPQSREIENRQALEKIVADKKEFFDKNILERPGFWGGYILKPESIEFWQGRPSRLHDRIKYKKVVNEWKIVRLAP